MPLTEQGKEAAINDLWRRRDMHHYTTIPPALAPSRGWRRWFWDIRAPGPFLHRCIGCGAPIVTGSHFFEKPEVCDECEALLKLGWME